MYKADVMIDMRTGGRPMAYDVVLHDGVMFFDPPVFEGEGIRCVLVDR